MTPTNGCSNVPPRQLSTGIECIDAEHQRLLEFVDALQAICRDYENRTSCAGCSDEQIDHCEQALLDCVGSLLNYMVDHFRGEEELMKNRGIADDVRESYLQHTEDHANLTDRVARMTFPADRMQTVHAIAETATILRRWIGQHIEVHDLPMLR